MYSHALNFFDKKSGLAILGLENKPSQANLVFTSLQTIRSCAYL